MPGIAELRQGAATAEQLEADFENPTPKPRGDYGNNLQQTVKVEFQRLHDRINMLRQFVPRTESSVLAGGHTVELPSKELRRRFQELATTWRKETSHWSVVARKADHAAYREIIDLGWPVVPLLLAELQRKPSFWFVALQKITGADPASAESDGDVAAMARAWVQWGEARGYNV